MASVVVQRYEGVVAGGGGVGEPEAGDEPHGRGGRVPSLAVIPRSLAPAPPLPSCLADSPAPASLG